jgi:hypothetical protein
MTAKVISLCDFRRNRGEEKRSRSVNVLGLPSKEFCDKTFERSLKPSDFHKSLLSAYDPDLDLDED